MEVVPVESEESSLKVDVESDVVKCAEEAQIEVSRELLINLREMVNNPTFSDVVFVCQFGTRVHGSRMLLSGVSDVLKNMLMKGKAEASQSEFASPEIFSQALLSVFEFLYTGKVVKYPPVLMSTACEVIIASRFFLLPKLEKMTRKFINDQIVSVPDDLLSVASKLTEALTYYEAIWEGNDACLKELVTILNYDWSNDDLNSNLSEEAFQYLLADTKSPDVDGHEPQSLTEYLRFRQVISWWVYRGVRRVNDWRITEELMPLIAPDYAMALDICKGKQDFKSSCRDSGRLFLDPRHSDAWTLLQSNIPVRDSACDLLGNINYQQIPSVLLTEVVEPLGLVRSPEILNALRYHALRRHLYFEIDFWSWDHGKSYTESYMGEGYVVKKTGPGIGLAVAVLEVGRSYVVYQWYFIVEELSEAFCELGFMPYRSGGELATDGERLSDQCRARVLKSEGENVSVNWANNGGRCDWKTLGTAFTKGTTVMFIFDPMQRTCSLVIGSRYCGAVWVNLPKASYCPAVSLGNTSKGRVRMKLGSGFGIM